MIGFQVMYLYYLLGWKGYTVRNPQRSNVRLLFTLTLQYKCIQSMYCILIDVCCVSTLFQQPSSPCIDSMISMDGEIFLMPQSHNDSKRKFISDDKTYVLALDGDTDFQPKAVMLLVDRSVSLLENQTFFLVRSRSNVFDLRM